MSLYPTQQNIDHPNNFGGAQEQQNATNLKNHLALVDSHFENTQVGVFEYKKNVEDLRVEQNIMKQKLLAKNEDILNSTTPQIDALIKDLKLIITSQKDENSKLQGQITDLKKEKSQIQQLIIQSVQKLAIMEESIGSYSS